VAITDVDASYYGLTRNQSGARIPYVPSSTGYYSLNALNTTRNLVPVSLNDVAYVINGPGAAQRLGNPFGNVARNSQRGALLNQANLGVFKNTKIMERMNIQFRAEFFNVFNHPNAGYGVAGGANLYDNFVDDAGSTFNDRREAELSSRRVQFGLRLTF